MPEKIKNYRDLNIWKLGIETVEDIYKITEDFPDKEIYGLSSQMRRCSVSIPSNVAEGFSRQHSREYRQFLHISLGSCAELETQVEIAFRLKYIDAATRDKIFDKINHIARMIVNLLKHL